ncbi:MAG: cation:proton antiporter [Oscillospiraceae bacterium]|jgi:Kef-type K+ transport system membrane component KefB|nr:cation:proton antiporter [Oscillospiraceae bacterium]
MQFDYHYLLDLAIILLTTKIFGLITRRLHMPQVVGALIAGIVFGPLLLNVLTQTVFIKQLSELGVIMIMFTAGLSTNLNELRQTGKAGLVVALIGVVVPLAGGMGVGFIFNHDSPKALMENIFLGTVLTATSVSITVETLKEMGKLNTKVGSTILAAALIDDVLGLICLTVVSSFSGDAAAAANANVVIVLLKILAFFVLAIGFGFIAIKGLNWYAVKLGRSNLQRFHLFAFIICLLMAFAAEHFFGVADIIGAFAAGLIIGNTLGAPYMEQRFHPLSYLLLTPVFFASLGLSIQRTTMNLQLILFTVALLAMAVLSKLVGCGVGAKLCGMTKKESIQVGFGMVCRGEVALIVANKGMAAGVVPPEFFGPIIVLVVFCSVVTPILLKMSFKGAETLPEVRE